VGPAGHPEAAVAPSGPDPAPRQFPAGGIGQAPTTLEAPAANLRAIVTFHGHLGGSQSAREVRCCSVGQSIEAQQPRGGLAPSPPVPKFSRPGARGAPWPFPDPRPSDARLVNSDDCWGNRMPCAGEIPFVRSGSYLAGDDRWGLPLPEMWGKKPPGPPGSCLL